MKKIFTVLAIIGMVFTLSAQITTPRFGTTAGRDNTGRVTTYAYSAPVYAATYTVNANASETFVKMGTLTGAQTVTANVTNSHVADKLVFMFTADTLTAGRVVTFSTNIVYTAATFTVDASQKATASFVFDGVKWIETGRAKQ